MQTKESDAENRHWRCGFAVLWIACAVRVVWIAFRAWMALTNQSQP